MVRIRHRSEGERVVDDPRHRHQGSRPWLIGQHFAHPRMMLAQDRLLLGRDQSRSRPRRARTACPPETASAHDEVGSSGQRLIEFVRQVAAIAFIASARDSGRRTTGAVRTHPGIDVLIDAMGPITLPPASKFRNDRALVIRFAPLGNREYSICCASPVGSHRGGRWRRLRPSSSDRPD